MKQSQIDGSAAPRPPGRCWRQLSGPWAGFLRITGDGRLEVMARIRGREQTLAFAQALVQSIHAELDLQEAQYEAQTRPRRRLSEEAMATDPELPLGEAIARLQRKLASIPPLAPLSAIGPSADRQSRRFAG
ncbi:MAG: hypothetical protein K1X75_11250 [Leptospirales bacterium]|nr:hypothetical protein [Leptospirales bacterium]